GVLATIGVASGTLLALIWPLGGMLHDVALDVGAAGADPRILGGWDAVAPYSLAFSSLARVFFVGAIVLGLRLAGTAPRLQRPGLPARMAPGFARHVGRRRLLYRRTRSSPS